MDKTSISLKEIQKSETDANLLYSLLESRTHRISHTSLPSIEEHKEFVFNHPYRSWYFVLYEEICTGTVYLLDNNCIGINISENHLHCVIPAIDLLTSLYQPLKAIKSIRGEKFYVNVPTTNTKLANILKSNGANPIQTTYELGL